MSKEKKMIEGQLSLFDLFGENPELVPEVSKIEVTRLDSEKCNNCNDHGECSVPKSFSACLKCWCRDCKHNAANEGVLRDICGNMLSCPACDMCVNSDDPQICIIGSAKEGCSVRAAEEGIWE